MHVMGRLSWRAGGALLLFLCIAVAGSAALTAGEIEVSLDTPHIIAGDSGGTIDVTVTNDSVNVTSVTFEDLNSLGSLTVTSDSTEPYQTVFSSTKAGIAPIGITIGYKDGATTSSTYFEYNVTVIPSYPYGYLNITYDEIVPVNASTDITVRMKDQYGNVINDKTGTTIEFWIGDGDQPVIQNFSKDGDCTVTFNASKIAHTVLIGIYPVDCGKSLDRIIDIEVVSLDDPSTIEFKKIETAPDEPYPVEFHCLAGTTYYFDVGIIVTDIHGNPIANYPVEFSTTLGGIQTIITGNDGIAHAKVGPQKTIGDVEITAKVEGLPAITKMLTFTGGEGEGFKISVNPADLPSYEVNPDVKAAIVARVHNAMGTGVEGQDVSFKITPNSITKNKEDLPMQDPVILSTNPVKTDADGYAIAYLRAGAFPDHNSPDYYDSAMGNCNVTATWGESSQISPVISWRNYPYLRVETNVSDTVVAPGEKIDVSIYLIGDGYDFANHKPIDVVLCLDRGEDMLMDEVKGRDRMLAARSAAMRLVRGNGSIDDLSPKEDRVALLTYGDPSTNETVFPYGTANILTVPGNYNWAATVGDDAGQINDTDDRDYVRDYYHGNNVTRYTNYTSEDIPLTSTTDWTDLETALDLVVPINQLKTGEATAPLRLGLKASIDLLKDSNSAVKAIVVLMQNNYCYYGNPIPKASDPVLKVEPWDHTIAQGTNEYYPFDGLSAEQQNMARYAADKGIKIFVIYYPQSKASKVPAVVETLANTTGGEYYIANSEEELNIAFDDARKKLLRDAGLETQVHLSFAEVPENFSYTSTELLTYRPNTTIDFFNWTNNPYNATSQEDRLEGYAKSVDQTDSWIGLDGSPGTLDFAVGNVSLKQTWMTKFSFTVNESISEPLNFSLFGGNSKITFQNNDGTEIEQVLSPITITVIPGLAPEALFNATIEVYNFTPAKSSDELFSDFSWKINYTGAFPMDEQFYIRNLDSDDTSWKKIGSITVPNTASSDKLSLFIGDLENGLYEARIRVSTADAGYDEKIVPFGVGIFGEDYYIRLS